jgi:UDP-N-acetylmuramoyl-L-alanyl-D-glutamate--2,6-diaminopimelate ligase
MKLKELYQDAAATALAETVVGKVTNNSQKVDAGDVFVCIRGAATDGHTYAPMAAKAGASVIVCDHDLGLDNQLIVEDTRKVYALMCSAYFGHPAKKMKLIGVTGTNGKTSTCLMIQSLLESRGHKTGLIGTIHNTVGEQILPAKNTTPDAYELHSLFSLMEKSGCEYVVMEVSSHAIDQDRVYGLHFACCVYTNLTQDHLDYHKTMENYLEVKQRIFSRCDHAVVNVDDKYADAILSACDCPVTTYAVNSNDSDFVAKNLRKRADGVDFEMVGDGVIGRVKLKIPGEFSVYNAVAAGSCSMALGVSFSDVVKGMCDLESPKGRAEVVPVGERDFTVIIDYAHTPDGLEKTLKALKPVCNNRLICVFGCGGNRDAEKRGFMGSISGKLANFTIITSDNPRFEEPMDIINSIEEGLVKVSNDYVLIQDGVEAIDYAIKMAKSGDVIVVAGKGSEKYQDVLGIKHLYNDKDTIKQILKEIDG